MRASRFIINGFVKVCSSRKLLVSAFFLMAFQMAFALTELGLAPKPLGEFDFVRIPLKQVGKLILIEAKIEEQTGFFILDTGAPYLVLNETYFRNGHVIDQRIFGDVGGYVDTVNVINIERFELRSLRFEAMEADLVDLSNIEEKRGEKILGLIGLSFFLEMEMRFDLPRRQLELHRTDKKGETQLASSQCQGIASEAAFKVKKNVMIIKGDLAGEQLNFCLDTGAEVTVLSNDLKENVYQHIEIKGAKTMIGSSSKGTQVLFGAVDQINLGAEILDCQVVITDLKEMSISYGVRIDGMIGYDLLSKGKVIINFKKHLISFCL